MVKGSAREEKRETEGEGGRERERQEEKEGDAKDRKVLDEKKKKSHDGTNKWKLCQ